MLRQLNITLDNGKNSTIAIHFDCIELIEYDTSKTCLIHCIFSDGVRSFKVRMPLESMVNKMNMEQSGNFNEN